MAEFDVVVVGGGAVGTSALHHLMARGAKSALLLERLDGYGRGATGIWGSLVRMFYERQATTESASEAVPFYVDFEREVGAPCPWNRIGSLYFLKRSDLPRYERHLAALTRSGLAFELVDPVQGRRQFPEFAWFEEDVAVYEPNAGVGSPRETTEAFLRSALRRGAKAELDAEVVEILVEGDRATGVLTRGGARHTCAQLIVCAGIWTNRLLEPTGERIATFPLSLQLNRFSRLQGARRHPFFIDLPALTFGHPTGSGSFIGGYQGVVLDPGHGGVEHLSPAVANQAKHKLSARIPWLKHATLEGGIKALESYTESSVGLVERLPRLTNVIVSSGWSCSGFTLAPVIGRRIAELALG